MAGLALKLMKGSIITPTEQFYLQARTIKIQHEKSPISSSLPGSEPLLLDLGQWKVNITIEGDADVPPITTDEVKNKKKINEILIADKLDLETLANPIQRNIKSPGNRDPMYNPNPWYKYTMFLEDSTTTNAKLYYIVKLQSITLSKSDVRDYYQFILQLVGFLGKDTSFSIDEDPELST